MCSSIRGVSPGLVLLGKRGDAGCSIVQALRIAARLVGSCQHGLDIQHNVWIRRRQREAYAREPFAQRARIQRESITYAFRTVHAHQVVIRSMLAGGPFGDGYDMWTGAEQINFDKMSGTPPYFGLLGHV